MQLNLQKTKTKTPIHDENLTKDKWNMIYSCCVLFVEGTETQKMEHKQKEQTEE